MNANEGLGLLGWVALGLIALMAVSALLFGFSSLFYFAILLVPVVFVVLLQLCAGKLEA
jgi:uncharacterized membrane protein YhdT